MKWAKKNPEANREYQRKWAKAQRDKMRQEGKRRDYLLQLRHGISESEWNEMFEKQGFCCAICKIDKETSKVGWHTDHDHSTGKVRGVLCANCNRGLGMYKDDITFLLKAAKYLGLHQGILTGSEIAALGVVSPIHARTVENGLSFGVGPVGYDIRIAQNVQLPSKGFSLASSIEYFDIPNDMVAFVYDKSTHARRGLSLFNTVAEPGWRGYLTLELFNASDNDIDLKVGDPIAQMIFHRLDQPTEGYGSGKYQDQPARPVEAIREEVPE
jgi:dCTP deaminase